MTAKTPARHNPAKLDSTACASDMEAWSSRAVVATIGALGFTPLVFWSPVHWTSVPAYDLAVGALFVLFAFSILYPKLRIPRLSKAEGCQFLFICWIVINSLTRGSWEAARAFLDLLLVSLIITQAKFTKVQVNVMVFSLLVSGFIVASWSLCAQLQVNRNTLSGYLSPFLPMSLFLWCSSRRSIKLLGILITTVLAFAVTMTLTRAGYLASIVGMIVFALIKDKRMIVVPIVYMLVCGAVVKEARDRFFKIGGLPSVVQAGNEEGDTSLVARRHLWEFAWQKFGASPALGIGIGKYKEELGDYRKQHPNDKRFPETVEPHNAYLKVLCEMGLPGLSLFLAVLATSIWGLFSRKVLPSWSASAAMDVGILSALITFLLHVMTNTLIIVIPCAFVFWVLVAFSTRASEKIDLFPDERCLK